MSDSTPNPAVQTLQDAAQGLLFPSETDAPLLPFFWPQAAPAAPTPELVAQQTKVPADAPIKSQSIARFFAPATKEEEWHNDEEREQVRRFRHLLEVIQATLKDVKAFRIGETDIDVYIVGSVQDGLAGLQTKVVET